MTTPVDLYTRMKSDITGLITEDNQHTTIPACPEWTLRDIVGHLVGSIEDFHNGNIDDFGKPHWTAAQVDRYADRDLAGVKQAWDDVIASMGDGFAQVAEMDLPDIATHEFDVRGALGNTDNRDSAALPLTFAFLAEALDGKFRVQGIPALRVIADGEDTVIGDGESEGELRASLFELSRAATGRRSLAQMRALDWSTDPSPWVEQLSLMPPRDTDLIE